MALLILIVTFFPVADSVNSENTCNPDSHLVYVWKKCELEGIVSYDLFKTAMQGYKEMEQIKDKKIITIIDYTKPSTKKRLYVINLAQKELLYTSYVAHGKNSGKNYAKHFSNQPGSKKSCLGFFVTAETYYGKHGYSLRLDGVEKGINDNARKRLIVIHGAEYVSQEFINTHGRLGRSWGCPALPVELTEEIIDSIANGSCLFIFGNDAKYFKKSKYIKSKM